MRRLSGLLVMSLVLVWGAHAGAQGATESVEIPFERYTLPNGLEVILHQDNDVPLVAVDVWYHVGSGDEVPGKTGFAHLFEHMMFQGSKHVGEDKHFDVLRKAGASSINGTTNSDRTNYFEVLPSNQLETALWLESDRMGYMLDLLSEKSLKNQIDVVRNERRQRYDNVAYGKARFEISTTLFPEGHPYRYMTIGRHEDIEGAKLDDVHAFFKKWYVPSNATLTISGDIDTAATKELIQKWFGSFPAFDKPARVVPTQPKLEKPIRRVIEDNFASRARVEIVWHSAKQLDDDDFSLSALANVLGSEGWGRLYRRLVLEEKIAHKTYAYQWGVHGGGQFRVIVELNDEKDVEKAEKIVAEVLAEVHSKGITDKELQRAIVGEEASLVFPLESVLSRAERLQWFNHYTGDPGYTATYLKRLRAQKPEGVQKAAGKWLGPNHLTVVSIPKKAKTGVDKTKTKAKKGKGGKR